MKSVVSILVVFIFFGIASFNVVHAVELVDIRSSEYLAKLQDKYKGKKAAHDNANDNINDNALKTLLLELIIDQHQLSNQNALESLSQRKGARGIQHYRFQQTYKGIPVWGEQVIAHSKNGIPFYLSGRIASGMSQDLLDVDLVNTLNEQEALHLAKQWLVSETKVALNKWRFDSVTIQKVLYPLKGSATLVYHVHYFAEADNTNPSRPNIMIDASTGDVLNAWEGLTQADAIGPGGNEKIGRYEYGIEYAPLNVTKDNEDCLLKNGLVTTVSLDNITDESEAMSAFRFNCPENTYKTVNGAYSPLNDAHFYGSAVYNLFQDWFGISPLTFPMTLRVHYGDQYENAFWDGKTMTFGDGRDIFYPLVDINIVAHEAAHGFTEQNSGLIYYGQSGGINEAFSDIVGEAAEYYIRGTVDWLAGADIVKQWEALRYFKNPGKDGLSIKHVDEYYEGLGVHFSSGVFNHAYYLLSTSPGWDPKKALELFVLANQSYWSPSSDFYDAACGVLLSALELDYAWQPVNEAFTAVGLSCLDLPVDEDADGMGDLWEAHFGLDVGDSSGPGDDGDNDGLTNLEEFNLSTDPRASDTDADGLSDGDEVNTYGTNPLLSDSDADALPDGFEVEYELNPSDPNDAHVDSDNDGFTNLEEYLLGTEPKNEESVPLFMRVFTESFESTLGRNWMHPKDGLLGWAVDEGFATAGKYSLKAKPAKYGVSVIEWLGLFSDGELQFDINITGGEFLMYVDNTLAVIRNGGEPHRIYVDINKGIHRIRFQYSAGWPASSENSAWIDRLQFVEKGDFDNDGIPNTWEVEFGLNLNDGADVEGDIDADGLNNLEEFQNATRPDVADTDHDGLSDAVELKDVASNPLLADTDADQLPDGWEVTHGLQVTANDAKSDSDGDSYSNLEEYVLGSAPDDRDSLPAAMGFYSQSFERFENSGTLPWRWPTLENNAAWYYSSQYLSHDGKSLRSHPIVFGETSAVEFSRIFEQGVLYFDWAVESDPASDSFSVYLDDELIFRSWGTYGWSTEKIEVSAGLHTIRWVYSKNGWFTYGKDAAFIDNVVFFVPNEDEDGDGLSNEDEYLEFGTALDSADTDADGLSDSKELELGTNPNESDSDADGVIDGEDVYPVDPSRNANASSSASSGGGGGGGSIGVGFFGLALFGVYFRRKGSYVSH